MQNMRIYIFYIDTHPTGVSFLNSFIQASPVLRTSDTCLQLRQTLYEG